MAEMYDDPPPALWSAHLLLNQYFALGAGGCRRIYLCHKNSPVEGGPIQL